MIRAGAVALIALACGSASAAALSKEDYKASRAAIAAEYQADRQKCGARYGNAADLCIARAHGARDVAKAELEAAFKPSPDTDYRAAIARMRAAYAIAKEECDNQQGFTRKTCMREARAATQSAKSDAILARTR